MPCFTEHRLRTVAARGTTVLGRACQFTAALITKSLGSLEVTSDALLFLGAPLLRCVKRPWHGVPWMGELSGGPERERDAINGFQEVEIETVDPFVPQNLAEVLLRLAHDTASISDISGVETDTPDWTILDVFSASHDFYMAGLRSGRLWLPVLSTEQKSST